MIQTIVDFVALQVDGGHDMALFEQPVGKMGANESGGSQRQNLHLGNPVR
jgi:hypothetical protein